MQSATATAPAPERVRLRLALFSGNYNYVMDGPVRALNKLVARLEERGHAALIIAPTTDEPALVHSGELISAPSIPLPGRRSEYRLGLGFGRAGRRRLGAFAPNIVHLAAPDYLGLAALSYARRRGLPAVASFHTRFDTYPRYYGMKWFEKYVTDYMRYFYRRCARVYAPSPSMVDELAANGIGEDVRLWTRGVDRRLFSPARRSDEWRRARGVGGAEVLVAFVGRLVREKGIDTFAEAVAAARARAPGIRALVVGDGPERRRFEAMLPDAVFTGYLAGDGLARAYASADIFFNPSVTETFGNVTLEALASGLPCVCIAAAGSRSLVEHGVNGFLAPVAEGAAGCAVALTRLAADPDRRAAMGAAARARSADFDWNFTLDRLIDDYAELVVGGRRYRRD